MCQLQEPVHAGKVDWLLTPTMGFTALIYFISSALCLCITEAWVDAVDWALTWGQAQDNMTWKSVDQKLLNVDCFPEIYILKHHPHLLLFQPVPFFTRGLPIARVNNSEYVIQLSFSGLMSMRNHSCFNICLWFMRYKQNCRTYLNCMRQKLNWGRQQSNVCPHHNPLKKHSGGDASI